ncbi:MAG: type II secretion system protein [Candidatus Gracilibacteria bacterium]|nr:type II secretion system protein [Candidatus Gracilibacteria bacterium]MDD3120058.1 type II secretion system protein [Candidatus Gracilibacteria bacterium]MDD4530241.1 type II secretion system protein [Candidatus Gracilibacteria bacterium]
MTKFKIQNKVLSSKINSKGYFGFTLIELIVSITILSIIMLTIFSIYSNVVQVSKKLELYRYLQQNIRSITELLANDIREKGVDYARYNNPSEKSINYSSGNVFLFIKGSKTYGIFKKKVDDYELCPSINGIENNTCDLKNPKTISYFGFYTTDPKKPTILTTDTVTIKDLKYYISATMAGGIVGEPLIGNPNSKEGKVTILLEIGIAPKQGISSSLATESVMKVQTTISENFYKRQ